MWWFRGEKRDVVAGDCSNDVGSFTRGRER
jgi:hypothetical protein